MPAGSSAEWEWLDAAVVAGDVGVAGRARSRIFEAVCADRDGPVARRLLELAVDLRSSVRRTVFDLLYDLCAPDYTWPEAAVAAERDLGDADEQVRRTAAWLLAAAGGIERAVAALDASADPTVRVAMVDAMAFAALSRRDGGRWARAVVRLRSDHIPAVRLVANICALRMADAAAWPGLDAAIRADLEASDGLLGAPEDRYSMTASRRWALALVRLDRERDCYALSEGLADPAEAPAARLAGVELAVEAMRTWRAAPARLAPMLASMLAEDSSAMRSAAAGALTASLTATRLAADRLAVLLDEPELGAMVASALGAAGDCRAVPHLVRLMRTGDYEPRLAEALTAVAKAGADPAILVAAARQVLTAHRDPCPQARAWHYCPAVPAMRVLVALGSSAVDAVPELIARVRATIDQDNCGEPVFEFHVLERIGPAAAVAAPLLRRYLAAGGRQADNAVRALLMITSDRAVADRFFAERPEQLRRCLIAPALLTWLTDHGGLTDRQHQQLRSLFAHPGAMQVHSAGALWRCEGPSAAGKLLEHLPEYIDDDLYGPEALRVLAEMGTHAQPVLGQLDRIVQDRHRMGIYLGDPDAEMRAEETLLAAVVSARDRIASACALASATADAAQLIDTATRTRTEGPQR